MEHIVHTFDTGSVLRDVSLHIGHSEVSCLLGPSGCGKTTLLRLAAGLETLQQGKITIGDRIVADTISPGPRINLPPEGRNIALMFQDFALFPHLSVRENIDFGRRTTQNGHNTWVEKTMERMGMADFMHRYPHELSGGQQQRVALIRALASEPSILLLDEPFSGLDINRRAQVREQTLELLRETGHTALMVTHDPEEAMFMADRILVMNEGVIVQNAAAGEVYTSPASAFVATLFGETNCLPATCTVSGQVETPFGPLQASGMKPGETGRVIVRADAIRINQEKDRTDGCKPEGTLVASYPTGRSTAIRVSLNNAPPGFPLLHARVPGVFVSQPGTRLSLSLDSQQVFVFPDSY